MVFNVRNRSLFIIIVGLVCLAINYCWQYRACCDTLNNVAKIRQANEGFRPPVYFTISRKKIQNHNVEFHLPLLPKRKFKKFKHRRIKVVKKLRKTRKPTNLMIISQGRSGSSFVGQIFNQDPRVFFIYEPLMTIERVENIDTFVGNNTQQYQTIATRLLSEVFNCSFTNSAYLEYLSRPGHFRMSSRVLKSPPFCAKDVDNFSSKEIIQQGKCRSLDAKTLDKICRNYTVKVVKVLEHRLPGRTIENLPGFLRNPDFDNKILYLVRDPRAFILSMYQSGWIARLNGTTLVPYQPISERFQWYVKRICSQMEENIRFVKNHSQSHVLLLRYEDLVMRTGNATQKLFEFVGLQEPRDLKTWLHYQMHASNSTVNSVEGRYSTQKNSTYSMMRWRTEASVELVKTIEQHCKPVMDAIGYAMTNGSASVQFDLNVSLVKDV